MTAWMLAKCLYMVAGGLVTPSIVSVLFPKAKGLSGLGEPIPAFLVAVSVLAMWPMLLTLIVESKSDR